MYWGVEWQEDFGEADSDLRCMINNLNYELIDTMADEGFYPERSIMNEEKYKQSGRTNGLFNGLETAFILLLIWAISLLHFARLH